ncbi:hypothetical protein SAMN05444172_9112 [Burkholderia sp. GAS332]|nr:hypothetical protein SAMN05444172_9112 [Burkholderia sp. GAS332]
MKIKTAMAALVLAGLTGCVTQGMAPVSMSVEKSRTYGAPFDQVWTAVIGSIADKNLPVTTLEKASGLIAINGVSYSPGDANEGYRGSVMGVSDQIVNRNAKFNIFATRQEDGKTIVRVNTSFAMQVRTGNGSHVFPYQYQWQQSYSNGNIERGILNEIQRRLNSPQAAR